MEILCFSVSLSITLIVVLVVSFAATTLDTGQGANELYDMDQNVTTSSNVTFGTLNCSDLTISGTTTTINTATLTVDDKNIELGSVATPTDVTANAGGITLKGATDKTKRSQNNLKIK